MTTSPEPISEAKATWPAAAVEMVPLVSLIPYARNARTHSDAQIETIAALMLRFGFTNSVLRDEENTIIAGHGRVMAAKLLVSRGHLQFSTVPVITARGWSENDRRAYVIADNQSALMAGWDDALLGSELTALAGCGFFDAAALGFGADEIRRLMGHGGLTDPDEAPDLPVGAVSKLGDLWVLGEHRLLCGDCTDRDAVARVTPRDTQPHLMVTDPPYGVNYDPTWRLRAGIAGTGLARGKVQNDDRADWRAAWALFPGAVAYVWHGGLHAPIVGESLAAARFRVRAQIIWVKSSFVMSRGAYHWQHEPALYATKEGAEFDHWARFDEEHECLDYAVKDGSRAEWRGGRKQSTVWNIELVKNNTGHGTQKPIECMRRPVV